MVLVVGVEFGGDELGSDVGCFLWVGRLLVVVVRVEFGLVLSLDFEVVIGWVVEWVRGFVFVGELL